MKDGITIVFYKHTFPEKVLLYILYNIYNSKNPQVKFWMPNGRSLYIFLWHDFKSQYNLAISKLRPKLGILKYLEVCLHHFLNRCLVEEVAMYRWERKFFEDNEIFVEILILQAYFNYFLLLLFCVLVTSANGKMLSLSSEIQNQYFK